MKIYHTETQADFDALMNWLETKGIKTLEKEYWKIHGNQMVVFAHAIGPYGDNSRTDTTYGSLSVAFEKYPRVPIIKYKAKVDEKMKFTKENVEKVIDEYFRQADFEPCGDLIAEIHNLDDTPEKVVVPKFVAEFYEGCKDANLYFLITQLESEDFQSDLGKWYRDCEGRHIGGRANAQEVIAKMKLYGYEVEKEPLYCVNINGQYLVKMIPERNVHKFVEEVKLCVWDPQAYQLTEAEIKAIDERYWPFAAPVND